MKNILLIGASGGIGNEVAKFLLNDSFNVMGTYFQHPERIENLKRIKGFIDCHVDVRDIKSIKNLYAVAKKHFSELFAVV